MRSAAGHGGASRDPAASGPPPFEPALRAIAAAPPVPLEALAPPLPPGSRLDEFELLEVIGQGGMGVVYRARDTQLQRDVAIKVLSPSWSLAAAAPDALLEREARATARLSHPSIVTIHRVGRHAGRLYLVLELLAGEPLDALLQRRQLDRREALRIGLEMCEALAHAHAHGVVHRDVKPGNVFVESSGRVKVLDFGLSGLADGGSSARSGGSWAGTPAYMAPEQWRGEPADARTDVHAAGVVLDELMAASEPARGPAAAGAGRGADSPIDARLHAIIARATARDREHRYADAGRLAAALRPLHASSRPRRMPLRLALAVAAGLLAVAGGGILTDDAPLPDLSGVWEADRAAFGQATLRRVAPDEYAWEHRKGPVRTGADTFYNRGTLRVRRDGERVLLEGRLADVPGWCCGNVGFLQLEVKTERALRVAVSTWGERHGHYTTLHVPYGFRRRDDRRADRGDDR